MRTAAPNELVTVGVGTGENDGTVEIVLGWPG